MTSFTLPDHSQSLLVIGKNGSGKTLAAVWHLAQHDLKNGRWFVINHKREPLINSIPGATFMELDARPKEGETGVFIFQPRPEIDDDAVEAILWWAYENGNVGIYIDEGYMISPRSAALNSIYTQGRSKRIPAITLSQRPSRISRFAVSEATFYQVFVLTDRRDRKTIGEFIPVDMDDFMTPRDGAPRILQPYHSLYYDTRSESPLVLSPVPGEEEILDQLAQQLLSEEEYAQLFSQSSGAAFNPESDGLSTPMGEEKPAGRLRLI